MWKTYDDPPSYSLLLYIMKIRGLHNFHSKCDTSQGGFTIVLGG